MKLLLLLYFLIIPEISTATWDNFGYKLAYSLNNSKASQISSQFSDLNKGHYSAFYIENNLNENLSFSMNVGAGYFEGPSNSQFSSQYNYLSLNTKSSGQFYVNLGLGIGGAICTLSTGQSAVGTIQTGTILHDSMFIWTNNIGFGLHFLQSWSMEIEYRRLGYFNHYFNKLVTDNLGLTLSHKM